MQQLRIGTLRARYHLAPSQEGERSRLDQLLGHLAGDAVELALEQLGLPDHEEVCIRRVEAPVRLRLSEPDHVLVRRWSEQLAESIHRTLQRGTGVVRFHSRRQALFDLAVGVARGSLQRLWAWRQLGLGPYEDGITRSQAARLLAGTLAREPACVVPVLEQLARRDLLAVVAGEWGVGEWQALAVTALGAAGLSLSRARRLVIGSDEDEAVEAVEAIVEAVVEAAVEAAGSGTAAGAVDDTQASSQVLRHGQRCVQGSCLGRELQQLAEQSQPVLCRACAVLAVLAAEPGLGRYRDEDRTRLIAGVTERLGSMGSPAGAASRPLMARWTQTQEQPEALVDALGDEEPSDGYGPIEEPSGGVTVERQSGRSEHAGLLFLVGLVEDQGLPDRLATGIPFPDRSWRWVWHQLALLLLCPFQQPVDCSDPAVLAFAGLGPEEPPPSLGEEEASESELAVLWEWRRQLVTVLAGRLQGEEYGDPEMLIERLCRRRALIMADPGWIEVQLSLAEVDTGVRRAGLDLDPGYLPWLGVVLRFCYA